jgi:hypothetical protein
MLQEFASGRGRAEQGVIVNKDRRNKNKKKKEEKGKRKE